jgi:hypothetical protein
MYSCANTQLRLMLNWRAYPVATHTTGECCRTHHCCNQSRPHSTPQAQIPPDTPPAHHTLETSLPPSPNRGMQSAQHVFYFQHVWNCRRCSRPDQQGCITSDAALSLQLRLQLH